MFSRGIIAISFSKIINHGDKVLVFSDEKRASDELSRDLECKSGPAKEPVAGVGKGERGGRNWVGSLEDCVGCGPQRVVAMQPQHR